jgi:hypothetical protein
MYSFKLTTSVKSFATSENQVADSTKNVTYSVSAEHLWKVDAELLVWIMSGDFMHVNQRYVTHLTDETVTMLRCVTEGEGWASQAKEEMFAKIKRILELAKSTEYLKEKKEDALLRKRINKLVKDILAARRNENEEEIEVLEAKFEEAVRERDTANRFNNFGLINQQVKAASAWEKLLKEGSKKEGLNEGEFLFLQAMSKCAGAFNAQHSMELTNGRGLKALEKQAKIHKTTCEAFAGKPDLNKKVKVIMDWWLMMATDLFEIGKMLKCNMRTSKKRRKKQSRVIPAGESNVNQ